MMIADRKEFATKPAPLTCRANATVYEAVVDMAARNFGSIVVLDKDERIEGMMTERDIFRRVIAEERDPKTTTVGEVMTRELRMAKKTDDYREWLRIMSNERFRRLPIVDEDRKLVGIMTQGDFVSYTWPDLVNQAGVMARAAVAPVGSPVMIVSAVLIYSLVLVLILTAFL